MTANLKCFIKKNILTHYDSVDRSPFVGFFFVHIECVTCLVHESCVVYDDFGDRSSFVGLHIECVASPVHASFFVFRHNAVCSTQGLLFVLDPQDISPVDIPSRNTSLALTPTILFYCSPVFGTQVLLSRAWS